MGNALLQHTFICIKIVILYKNDCKENMVISVLAAHTEDCPSPTLS